MSGQRRSVQIPDGVYAAIEKIAHASGRDAASVLDEMLEEAVKMRRVRGIVFADEFQRREAKVGGTGLGVWEVIETYQIVGEDWDRISGVLRLAQRIPAPLGARVLEGLSRRGG